MRGECDRLQEDNDRLAVEVASLLQAQQQEGEQERNGKLAVQEIEAWHRTAVGDVVTNSSEKLASVSETHSAKVLPPERSATNEAERHAKELLACQRDLAKTKARLSTVKADTVELRALRATERIQQEGLQKTVGDLKEKLKRVLGR
jgi:chromosome segregation ATPase